MALGNAHSPMHPDPLSTTLRLHGMSTASVDIVGPMDQEFREGTLGVP